MNIHINEAGILIQNGELFVIHELHLEGLSISEIAKRTGKDRKTVRKYINRGLVQPVYGPRQPRPQLLDPYRDYLRDRIELFPGLRATRLLREIQALGYRGGYSRLTDYLRDIRPVPDHGFEHRYETAAGEQAQVDFAQFKTVFTEAPDRVRVVWLFSLVLGCSRFLTGQFVFGQTLPVVLRCHIDAFAQLGGVPRHILYDRMKTAVLGETETRHIVYNSKLLELASHYGFQPRACPAYRAKTKGKVERPFSYIRDDFFLGRCFRDIDDLNEQFTGWRDGVANERCHGTTRRVVREAFDEERESLQPLPAQPFGAVLSLQRRVSRDGMVSIQGNFYSVPDRTRSRVVEVQTLADEIRIYDGHDLLATHPVLTGRGQRQVLPNHRQWPPPGLRGEPQKRSREVTLTAPGYAVSQRDLAIYDQIGSVLAGGEPA